jgi:leucyl aminopeptidase
MKVQLKFNAKSPTSSQLVLIAAFQKKDEASLTGWPSDFQSAFTMLNNSKNFKAKMGQNFFFSLEDGTTVCAMGMGERSKATWENLRTAMANMYKANKTSYTDLSVNLDTFVLKSNLDKTVYTINEALLLTSYTFEKYLSKKSKPTLKTVYFDSKQPKSKERKAAKALLDSTNVVESVNVARDFVNEPPNVLHSESYAKMVEKDAKKIKGVKVKIHGKAELKKEKMGMFLSVNAGSAHEPRLVQLTYTPPKATKKTKHICFVGKGLTFDTGGYSLKPGGSMVNMKYDMAGSATVYGAFRAAALLGVNAKVTCLLGMTDNAVNEFATMPDSIVTARNGKTVEILNTDAEGRLVLGDVLSYASDLKPDCIIDAATLTGAVLMALGNEMCGVMGNNQKLVDNILKSCKNTDEHAWQLPIIDEFRNDMKSKIADLQNISSKRGAGTAKAAAFLENFVDPKIAWAHLDIAGIGDSQSHLAYCPPKGSSGVMIRSLVDFVQNGKI